MQSEPAVLIVDDHPLFRDALEMALQQAFQGKARARQAACLADAEQAIAEAAGRLDLVLLDLNLPDADGLNGLVRLKSLLGETPLVVVSATEGAAAYAKARALGASGYLPKSLGLEELSAALATALDGGEWFPQMETAEPSGHEAARVSSLTPAQRRVLDGLMAGRLNKQIAFDMGLSVATVKAHLTAIFRKLGANNRTQAILIYQSAVSADDHSAA